jgi:tRNA threonylcarbamoyladenosine biosynthesis protein TsaE
VVALVGALGAGKTVFVKGLAAGLGLDPARVASPTFVIASEYGRSARGGARLAHLDLYRIERADELDAAGFADLLAGSGLVAIEWADRFREALPRDVLQVRLRRPADAAGETEREIEIEAHGPLAARVLERLERMRWA